MGAERTRLIKTLRFLLASKTNQQTQKGQTEELKTARIELASHGLGIKRGINSHLWHTPESESSVE